jgi:hypothetical protein
MRTLDAAPLFLQLAAEPNGARGEAATAEWVRVWESLTKALSGLVTLLNEERKKAACRKSSSDRRMPGVHRRGAEAAVRRR